MNNLDFIGKSANGKNIFNRLNSHIHQNVTKELLREAIGHLSLTQDFHNEVIDLERIIGKCACVPITEKDEVVYVIRKGRKGPTPMVKNRESIDCSHLTLLFKKVENECYILISTFIGSESAPEPWDSRFYDHITWKKRENIDKSAYQKSLDFWSTHALIYDEDDICLFLS